MTSTPPPPPPAGTSSSSTSAATNRVLPDFPNPNRPASPAPSYHTLPPNTDASLSTSHTASPSSLIAAAHTTPNALLTTLTLTNHTTSVPKHHLTGSSTGGLARHLSARTADGKERYRVASVEGALESIVWRCDAESPRSRFQAAEGQAESGDIVVGRLIGGSQGLSVVLDANDDEGGVGVGVARRKDGVPTKDSTTTRRTGKTRTLVNLQYEAVQKSAALELVGFTVEGRHVGLRWEVVTLATATKPATTTATTATTTTAASEGEAKHRAITSGRKKLKALDTHDSKRRHATTISSLRLVDSHGNLYAEYTHDVGLPDLHQDGEVWGQVDLRARAVLIDGDGDLAQKIDRAFLTLVVLLEAFVRVLGGNKRGERNWGNFAGGMACEVM